MNTEPIWKSWFSRHGAKLLLFARQQSRRPDEAEDLLKKPLFEFGRLYGHTGEVSPGLVYRAIRRLAIDWARIDRRQIRENKVALDSPLSFSFERTLELDERQTSSPFVQSSVFPTNKKKW